MTTSTTDLQAQLAALQAENAKLKREASKTKGAGISCKVSAKGACSVYGLGRFPVTLYKTQWTKLLDNVEMIKAFLEAQSELLADKD